MIHVIGAGFLGSIFLEEWFKRMYAMEMNPAMTIHDFDRFEPRNCANQNVQLAQTRFEREEDHPTKAQHLMRIGIQYGLSELTAQGARIEEENADDLLKDAEIIVSAVDNYATRKLLWNQALAKNIPIMHLGIAQDGTGSVEWSWGLHLETWPMSPVALAGKELPNPKLVSLPPCDLVGLRGLGLNTGLAAAKALGLLYGIDPENYFPAPLPRQLFTVWASTNQGHKMVEATTFEEDENGKALEVPQAAR